MIQVCRLIKQGHTIASKNWCPELFSAMPDSRPPAAVGFTVAEPATLYQVEEAVTAPCHTWAGSWCPWTRSLHALQLTTRPGSPVSSCSLPCCRPQTGFCRKRHDTKPRGSVESIFGHFLRGHKIRNCCQNVTFRGLFSAKPRAAAGCAGELVRHHVQRRFGLDPRCLHERSRHVFCMLGGSVQSYNGRLIYHLQTVIVISQKCNNWGDRRRHCRYDCTHLSSPALFQSSYET